MYIANPTHDVSPAASAPAAGPTTTSRVRGAVLVVLGTGLAVGLSAALFFTAPVLLSPGQAYDNSRFTGSVFEAWLVLGVLAWVALLGGVFAIGGVQLWRQGRYHPWIAKVAGAMAVITVAGIYRLNHLFS
jgi:hypothetical protein